MDKKTLLSKKKTLTFFVFIGLTVVQFTALGQVRDSLQVVNQGDERLDPKPEPIGGYESYLKWVYDHNRKRTKAGELGQYYRSIVRAVIDEQGNIGKIGVWRGIGMGYDEEAYRLINEHPVKKWIPGRIDGKPVRVQVEIEVDHRTR